MRVLVLGGYGFIGAEIVRALGANGFEAIGLGRDAYLGRRLLPTAEWIGADISALDAPEKWEPLLSNIDAIVNAAGALQDGARDRLSAVHDVSIRACVAAATRAGVKTFVQISATGAEKDAPTAFMRTKSSGDACLRESALDWVILKPGLVIGPNAYGGTALLRMLAGFPLILPLVHGEARLQTVAIGDVADAVIAALKGEIPMRADYDLVEEESHSLREIVRAMRGAQGFAAPLAEINLPRIVGDAVSLGADVAGLLGWRSPLRSTAMTVIAGGVTGDPRPWREARGKPLRTLAESLGLLRSSAQERAFARVELILPVMLLTLSAFWIASGVIGVLERESAAGNLAAFDAPTAMGFVIAGSLVDLWIGAGLLWRPFAKMAAIASALVAGAYLCLGSILAPALWLDPLGVYVKVIPAIVLSVVLALLLQER